MAITPSSEVTCEKCRNRLVGFTLSSSQSASCYNWDGQEVIVADGTNIRLTKSWIQEAQHKSRWLKKHTLHLFAIGSHLHVHNTSNKRSTIVRLCEIPEDIFEIYGPGAEAHIERDRVKILSYQLKDSEQQRAKAEIAIASEKLTNRINAILFGFDKLGIKASRSNSISGSGWNIEITPEIAELLLEKLK